MDDLIKRLIERIELTEEQARAAAGTVVEFLEEYLPESMTRELARLLEGGGEPEDPEQVKKATTAAVAATTAAINVTVLPGAH
jgi:hypothetical protein